MGRKKSEKTFHQKKKNKMVSKDAAYYLLATGEMQIQTDNDES